MSSPSADLGVCVDSGTLSAPVLIVQSAVTVEADWAMHTDFELEFLNKRLSGRGEIVYEWNRQHSFIAGDTTSVHLRGFRQGCQSSERSRWRIADRDRRQEHRCGRFPGTRYNRCIGELLSAISLSRIYSQGKNCARHSSARLRWTDASRGFRSAF